LILLEDRTRPRSSAVPSTLFVAALLVGAATAAASPDPEPAPAAPKAAAPAPPTPLEKTWGIKPLSLRQTAGGTMLDFRYLVVDAKKALPLFDRKLKPYLVDTSTGMAQGVPEETKLGALRSSPRNPPVAGKQYFIFFSNGYGTVKKGSKVTVVIGDCKVENLAVD
jgi:hypothetical protein